jgi:hypothetical protein
MSSFKLPLAMLGVGIVTYVITTDAFLMLLFQTMTILVTLIWREWNPPKPPERSLWEDYREPPDDEEHWRR